MAEPTAVFLDFDDTLNDPLALGAQYAARVGHLMATEHGGRSDAWASAAGVVLAELELQYLARFRGRPTEGYCEWLDDVRQRAADMLFTRMDRSPPHHSDWMRTTQRRALTGCDALFEDAKRAVWRLDHAGCTLHMASGQESDYLTAALVGCGLDEFVRTRYGPDLVDCAKEGPEYYRRVFASAGVEARDAIVVEDLPEAVHWILETGATAIQARISRERRYDTVPGAAAEITRLADLPEAVLAILAGHGR